MSHVSLFETDMENTIKRNVDRENSKAEITLCMFPEPSVFFRFEVSLLHCFKIPSKNGKWSMKKILPLHYCVHSYALVTVTLYSVSSIATDNVFEPTVLLN